MIDFDNYSLDGVNGRGREVGPNGKTLWGVTRMPTDWRSMRSW